MKFVQRVVGERKRHFWMLLLLCLLIPLAIGSIAYAVQNQILAHELRAGTTRWADFLSRRFEGQENLNALIEDEDGGLNNPELLPGRARVVDALDAVLHSGLVYQLDLINEACYCSVSVGSFAQYSDTDTPIALSWNHRDIQALEHIVAGGRAHVKGISRSEQLSVDRKTATQVGTSGQPLLLVVSGLDDTQPSIFGMAYFPFKTANGERYVLRLLMDMRGTAVFFRNIIWVAAGLGLAIIWASAWLIVRRTRLQNAAQIMSDDRAHYLAEHDVLTGVLNRNGFEFRVNLMLEKVTADPQTSLRILLIDIDKFKEINGYHGLPTGDEVLRGLAELLTGHFAEEAVIARLGGDDFVVADFIAAEDIASDDALLPTGFDLLVDDGNRLLDVSVSGGVAYYPQDGETISELFQAADLALHSAKRDPERVTLPYRITMANALSRRIWQANGVRGALQRGELVTYYQPLVDTATGRVEGLESLVRWEHPDHGTLTPADIWAALEDPHLLPRISECMIDQILHDLQLWRDEGLPYFSVGLNISEPDLRKAGFLERLEGKISDAGIMNAQIALEVTETAVSAANKAELLPKLNALRDAGFFIGLDDFGTGQSSITLLKEIPATAVKIDKSFVSGICHNVSDQMIVRHLVPLAHEMGYRVVAEGVETREQYELLRNLEVDLIQGWLFAKAVPAADVPGLVHRLNQGLPWESDKAAVGRAAGV